MSDIPSSADLSPETTKPENAPVFTEEELEAISGGAAGGNGGVGGNGGNGGAGGLFGLGGNGGAG